MSNIYLFAWGISATVLAFGPLVVAAYLESKNAVVKLPDKAVPRK